MRHFPEIRVGEPIRHEALTVFPLFADTPGSVHYVLSDEAISAGQVRVQEVDEAGSVPDLEVENTADAPVLFIEGEELVGAKQNRVLNITVLIAAHSKTRIPVSCVEQGRWGYRRRNFGSSGHSASPYLRHHLKKSVYASLECESGHHSDQAGVWKEVRRQSRSLGASSPTSAMADTFKAYQERLEEFQKRLGSVEGACGLVGALGDKIVAIDIFDKPSTCQRIWPRLLTGAIMCALEEEPTDASASPEAVEKLWRQVQDTDWLPTATVGLGEEFRSEEVDEVCGAALVFEETLLHGSVTVAK